MKYLITLSLAALTLYAFVKRTYKYASVEDEVEAPIDYEETREYKENEIWFSGMEGCWMNTAKHIQMLVMFNEVTIEKYVTHDDYVELIVIDKYGNEAEVKFRPSED